MFAFTIILWSFLTAIGFYRLLNCPRQLPSFTAWLLLITFLPILGPVIFFILARPDMKINRRMRRARARALAMRVSDGRQKIDAAPYKNLPSDLFSILRVTRHFSSYYPTTHNDLKLLADPVLSFEDILQSIDEAKKYVHIEYYIFACDEVTERLVSHLCNALLRGVEVRLLYDYQGSLWHPNKQCCIAKLRQAGGQVQSFMPFSWLFRGFNLNFRNHRKIIVVDGETGYTGGTNLGRDYFGPVHDTHQFDFTFKIRGNVVAQLEDIFATDWFYTVEEDLFVRRFANGLTTSAKDAGILVLEGGPDQKFPATYNIFFTLLNAAKEEILLITPYFLPDRSLRNAFVNAALRGVAIKLLLPHRSDWRTVQHASRSLWEPLMTAGVEIWEFLPRILHAKVLVVDNKWTVIGSSNVDDRSFLLNFELDLLTLDLGFAGEMRQAFFHALKNSRRVTQENFQGRGIPARLLEGVCQQFMPLL